MGPGPSLRLRSRRILTLPGGGQFLSNGRADPLEYLGGDNHRPYDIYDRSSGSHGARSELRGQGRRQGRREAMTGQSAFGYAWAGALEALFPSSRASPESVLWEKAMGAPLALREAELASRIRTSSSPRRPQVMGRVPLLMQSRKCWHCTFNGSECWRWGL